MRSAQGVDIPDVVLAEHTVLGGKVASTVEEFRQGGVIRRHGVAPRPQLRGLRLAEGESWSNGGWITTQLCHMPEQRRQASTGDVHFRPVAHEPLRYIEERTEVTGQLLPAL